MDVFITPLLSILIGEGQDYFHSLLTIRNGVSSILGSIFFGVSIQFLISRRIAKLRKIKMRIRREPHMKSLVTLLTYHLFVLLLAHLHHRFRELANLRYSPPFSLCSSTQQRIDLSKDRFPKTRILNLALCFYDSILSILTTTDAHFKQLEILYTTNYR